MVALYLLLLDEVVVVVVVAVGSSCRRLWLVELVLPLVEGPYEGNWLWWSAVSMCVSSFSKLSWVEDTVFGSVG